MYDHVPQVFLALAILVVYFKTGLYEGALKENNAQFKKEHKKRLNTQSVILKIVQLVSFILMGFRFITSCDSNKQSMTDDGKFTFYIENYIYLSVKILLLIFLSLRLLFISRCPSFPLP